MHKNTFKKLTATLLSVLIAFSCMMPAFAIEIEDPSFGVTDGIPEETPQPDVPPIDDSVTEDDEDTPSTDEPTEEDPPADDYITIDGVLDGLLDGGFEFSNIFASFTEMAGPFFSFIANNYGEIYEKAVDYLFSLYDQFVFFLCGRVTLHEGPVLIAFSGEAFGDVTQELELYVEKIDYEECGKGAEGYIDYSIVPTEGDFEPIAYRIALLDEDGEPHFVPLFQTHRIQHTFDTPAEWASYQDVTVTRYHKFEGDSEATVFSKEEHNDKLSQQVFFIDYSL